MRARRDAVDKNLAIYNSAEVAAHYAGLSQISPCESLVFDTYIRSGAAVLDLGVGGGRTTSYIAPRCSKYLGLDYASEMVRVCQSKFPSLEFRIGNASHLLDIPSGRFDAVIAAFNVVDYVIGAEDRIQCWQQCYRVLKPGGVLIFSSHNPRAVLVRPEWNRKRVREMSLNVAPASDLIEKFVYAVLNSGAAMIASLRALGATLYRIMCKCQQAAFWRGEGYVVDPAHGGLLTHCWVPGRVVAELEKCGFFTLRVLGADYPRSGGLYWTDWYYYVVSRPEGKTDRNLPAGI
jgi:SAM-dependent methyltransferase